jgi:DNA polymerase-1
MLRLPYTVDGDRCTINVIENDDDLREAMDFVSHHSPYGLSLDTEGTGLDMFSPTFRLRTIQFGDAYTAYVYIMQSVRDRNAVAILEKLFALGVNLHNAPFDLLCFDVSGLYPLHLMEEMYHDTRLLCHLMDPRSKMDGGIGHGLKDQTAFHIDPNAPDTQKDLKEEFRKIGATLQTGWAKIDVNNRTYLLYAGLDVIFTQRLHDKLRPAINREGYGRLARFEHEVQRVTTRMKRRGFKVDVKFSEYLVEKLQQQWDDGTLRVKELGVENMQSTTQIATALLDRGWTPKEFTKTGKPKTDKQVMEKLIEDVNTPIDVQELLLAIIESKRAKKWKTAYAEAMLFGRDHRDHVHPDINSLQARTSRMSIGNPPLQQLPSRGDNAWLIRRQVIADEGMVIGSADYDQVEFRVLAGLAGISQMKYAINNGIDLHDYTAELVYGKDFTKAQRSMGKGIGFGKVFGGGAATLSRQTGAPIEQVKSAIRSYEAAYHELPAFAYTLQREQRMRGGYILNYHGRYLPLDSGREYAAVNYSVQSIARDLLAQALIDLAKAGLDDYLLLPVHDEVLFQAPVDIAHEVAHTVGDIMSGTFIDVPISASGEIYGASWAHGYVYTDSDGVVRSKGTKNVINDWMEVLV